MLKKPLQYVKILLPVALGIYLVIHIYRELDNTQREALFDAFRRANYIWVFIALLMGLLSHYIRGYRWKYQLSAMGYNVPVPANFMSVMGGYLVNMVLPRAGEITRAAAITKYYKVPFQKGFGSIMAERALDLIILANICLTTLVLQYSLLSKYANVLIETIESKVSSPILWAFLVFGLVLVVVLFWLFRRRKQNKLIRRLRIFTDGLFEGLRSIARMKQLKAFLLATVAIWLLYIGMFWICFFTLPETSHLRADAIFAGFVIGSFAIVLIPGGIGAFPVGIMEVLALYGIAGETGFALGWILWVSQTAMIIVAGDISMLLLPRYAKRTSDL